MSPRNILLICRRELSDQLRDRRTLFMIAVLPLLLYPALGIGTLQLTVLFQEQPRTVVVLNADDLPAPPLIDGNHFAKTWFDRPEETEKLNIVTAATAGDHPEQAALLAQAENIADQIRGGDTADANDAQPRNRQRHSAIGKLFDDADFEVLVIVPAGFADKIAARGAGLSSRDTEATAEPARNRRPIVLHNSADERSLIAFSRVMKAVDRWERALLENQLQTAGLPADLPRPVNPLEIDLAEDEQLSANLWSKLFPAMLVIMALTGAFYPAIDLCAGEKERGTMETLLICPASRTDIVIGKFLTVMLFSLSTAILNLVSLGFTSWYMASLGSSGALSRLGDLSLPPVTSLFWVVLLLIPLSALFSALCLALATFAKSSKEGQYYLTPLLMATLGLTVFCLSPGVELEPFYSVMPVMGPALLLKGFLKETTLAAAPYWYVAPVLVTSIGYSLLALWWAIDQFRGEEVLFREAERFDIRLWLRHLLRDKEPTPSFAEAMFCFVVIMFLQFAAMRAFQNPLHEVAEADRGTLMMQLLIIQQLAIVATPPLIMSVMLTTSLRSTLRLNWPPLKGLAIGAALPFFLHPLTIELASALRWFFPQLPPSVQELMGQMADPSQSLWLALLAFAIAPGICEEVAFRGFLLSGFGHAGRWGLAVIVSAATFGLMHLIPQQVFNAALLGIVLGLLAVRTNSLLPGIVFHILYNGLEVLRFRNFTTLPRGGGWDWLWHIDGGEMSYQPLLLLVCAVGAALALGWLLSGDRRRDEAAEPLGDGLPHLAR